MIEMLSLPFVQTAILTAFVLTGIHTYLGFHIVSRGVIFVDLSLAQAAAFGSALAIILGFENNPIFSYIIALSFTFLGAVLISFAGLRDKKAPHEAFIGIIYAAFTAGTILLLSKRAEGLGELNHLIAGSLLTVSLPELLKLILIYSFVGIVHFFLRKKFITISTNKELAIRQKLNIPFWDCVFYAIFGIVVTSSVSVAGVMLVFSLLVIPPVAALQITNKFGSRLAIGWAIGLIGSITGVLLSLKFDFPVGPSIIAAMAGLLIVVMILSGKIGKHFKHASAS